MKKSMEMDEENDEVYYVPIEYHVPHSTQYDNLQALVMAALENSRFFINGKLLSSYLSKIVFKIC